MTTRKSAISVTLFRLQVDEEDCLLLLGHPKWGDWSLVGGHIEPGEDPRTCAEREVNEELEPLTVGIDLEVEPLLAEPLSWGPVFSRSAGKHTIYTAWVFAGRFLEDPVVALQRVRELPLALVSRATLCKDGWPPDVSDVLSRFLKVEGMSFDRIPLAWKSALRRPDVRVPLLEFDASVRRAPCSQTA